MFRALCLGAVAFSLMTSDLLARNKENKKISAFREESVKLFHEAYRQLKAEHELENFEDASEVPLLKKKKKRQKGSRQTRQNNPN